MTQPRVPEEDEGQDDGGVDRALSAEEREDRAGQRGERVGRGGERDVVVGERPVREVAPPDQRVERVVVDEPAAGQRPGDETEQERPADGLAAAHGRGPYRWGCPALRGRERVRAVLGRLLVGLAAVSLFAAAPAGAAVPSGNLVVNPGAEAGPGAPDSSGQPALPGWTVESTFTAVQYGAPAFLTPADSTALGGGVNFFAGGPGGAASAATQVIDVSGAAAEIDAGKVAATLSALLGGYATQTDHAAVTATFLNAAGAPAGAVGLPTVTPTDRNQTTALVARTASAAVPARHPPDLGAHRRDPRRGFLQRRLHRQREPRARLRNGRRPGLPQDRGGQGRSAARSACGGRAPTTSSTSRAPRASRSARRSTRWRVWWSSRRSPRRAASRRPAGSTRASSRSRRSGSVTNLALTEPLASCRGGAAAAPRRQEEAAPPLG